MSKIRENWCFQNECKECDYAGDDTCDESSNCMKCTGCLVQPGNPGLVDFLKKGSAGCLTEGCIYNCKNYKKLLANYVTKDNCSSGETVETKKTIIGSTILTGHKRCAPDNNPIIVPSNYITLRPGMGRLNLINNEIPLSLTDQVAMWYNIQLLGMYLVPYTDGDAEKADLAFKNNLEWIQCVHNEPVSNIKEALRIFGDSYSADMTINNPSWSSPTAGTAYANEPFVIEILSDIERILNALASGTVPINLARDFDCDYTGNPTYSGREIFRVISDFGLLRRYFTRGGLGPGDRIDFGINAGGFRLYDRTTFSKPTINSFPTSGIIILPPKDPGTIIDTPPPKIDIDDPWLKPPTGLIPLEPYAHTSNPSTNFTLSNPPLFPNASTEGINYSNITAVTCGDNNIGCGRTGNCFCTNGYSGDACEIKPIGCFNNTCKNGGNCNQINLNGDFTCDCDVGFKGQICQFEKGCEPNPCQNDTTCIEGEGPGEYTCDCPVGLTGTNCETNVDLCTAQPCQNGATCSSDALGYTCECVPGFTGTNCETNVDDCDGHTCLNESTCVDGVNGYTCGTCPTGFTGAFCGNTAAAPTFESCPDIKNAYTTLNTPLTDNDILDIKMEINTNGKTLDQLSCKYGPVELWNVKNVTNMDGLFYQIGKNNKIGSLDLTRWDVSNLVSAKGMFNGAVIGQLNLMDWRTVKLERATGMFQQSNIDDVILNGWNLAKCIDVSFMFYKMTASELKINWINPFFNNANQMFGDCDIGLIDGIGDWITNGLNSADFMFAGAKIDSGLYLNASRGRWDLFNLLSASYMFNNCNIQSIIANNWNLRSIRDTAFMFNGSTMDKLEMNYWTIAKSENGWVNTGGKSPFWKKLTDGGAEMFNMFKNCNIKSLSCYNLQNPYVTNLNFIFNGATCSNLLDIRKWDVPKVEIFFQSFYNINVGSFYLYDWGYSAVAPERVQMFMAFANAVTNTSIISLEGFSNPRKPGGLRVPLRENQVTSGAFGLNTGPSAFISPFMFQNANLGNSEVDISSWRGLLDDDIFSMFNLSTISTLVLPSDKGIGISLNGGTFSAGTPAADCKNPVSFCPV